MAEFTRDIRLLTDPNAIGQYMDFQVDEGDFVLDEGLESSVIISLFSDARVNPGESYNGQTGGFFAESLIGYNLGSKGWLLGRSKLDKQTLNLAQQYYKDSLKWAVDDGVYSKLELIVLRSNTDKNRIDIYIAAYRPDGTPDKFKFAVHWDAQLAR